ncbi:ABC transporter permease subunit [Candidatus Bathyarchaeota archaeon]|nr:ABC transporter permease subunit [Candidatus Bathyarchaeota archaeon]
MIKLTGGLVALCIAAWLIVSIAPYPEIKSLPLYTVSTIFRILIVLVISVAWGVSFGILAATNKVASVILTPFIDLLQSIPILGYFPIVIGFLFAIGPLGIELAVMVLLFTSMAWAIFFGVLGAIRGIPANVAESSRSFGLTGWRYIRHVILPAITPTVVSGANLAWCDGWFFVIAAEWIQYQGSVYTPPSGGLGFLLAKAAYDYKDMSLAVILLAYITFIVVYFNALTWHRLMERASTGTYKPVLRMDLSGVGKLGIAKATNWLHFGRLHWPKSFSIVSQRLRKYTHVERTTAIFLVFLSTVFVLYIVLGHFPTIATISEGLSSPPSEELVKLPILIVFTMGRLFLAYGISLVAAIGMGVLAAEHKRFATVFFPLYDIGQGVPILALFPVISLGLTGFLGNQGLALELTCIIMLVLDMIWYMFLNVVSAVKNIPSEINEVGQLLGFRGLKRITHIVVPSILPAIVTGSILSWGTGWNTIIFAEYLPSTGSAKPVSIPGIGSLLDKAGYEYGNTVVLVLMLGIISVLVLLMEAFVWRRLLRKFEKYHVEV